MKQYIERLSLLWSVSAILLCLMLTACCKDDDDDEAPSTRTVIVYMSGENSLSSCAAADLVEMKEGSKLIDGNDNLVVWYDRAMKDELPWLARIKNGVLTDSVSIVDLGISQKDEQSSAPHVFEKVLTYAVSHYPATDGYGLVLWGHASGWVLQDSIAYSRGYGVDNGRNDPYSNNGPWLNIPTIRKVLEKLPKLTFIFADCCNFMCLETLYELRNVTDYVIGSPAEIPDDGAPYETVAPAMFDRKALTTSILDRYSARYPNYLPLSAVKTSEMEVVAQATRTVMEVIRQQQDSEYADMTGTIHYYYDGSGYSSFNPVYNIFYDAGDFVRSHAPEADYKKWREILDRAVIDKRIATQWETNKSWYKYYTDFTMTEEKFHGVSMYVPQAGGLNSKYLRDIQNFAWYTNIF